MFERLVDAYKELKALYKQNPIATIVGVLITLVSYAMIVAGVVNVNYWLIGSGIALLFMPSIINKYLMDVVFFFMDLYTWTFDKLYRTVPFKKYREIMKIIYNES